MKNQNPIPNAKGVWYKITITECVLCGRSDTVRERKLPPKPEITHHYEQCMCSCGY